MRDEPLERNTCTLPLLSVTIGSADPIAIIPQWIPVEIVWETDTEMAIQNQQV